jgi:hypothetical protein
MSFNFNAKLIILIATCFVLVNCKKIATDPNDVENKVEICNDGLDNDGDGLTDCDDVDDCSVYTHCQTTNNATNNNNNTNNTIEPGTCLLTNLLYQTQGGCNGGFKCTLTGNNLDIECVNDWGSIETYGACSVSTELMDQDFCKLANLCYSSTGDATGKCLEFCDTQYALCGMDSVCINAIPNIGVGGTETAYLCDVSDDCNPVPSNYLACLTYDSTTDCIFSDCSSGDSCYLFGNSATAKFTKCVSDRGTKNVEEACSNSTECKPMKYCDSDGYCRDLCVNGGIEGGCRPDIDTCVIDTGTWGICI